MTQPTRVALITGGIGGIGTAICQRLAKDGCRVVANHHPRRRHLEPVACPIVEGDVAAVGRQILPERLELDGARLDEVLLELLLQLVPVNQLSVANGDVRRLADRVETRKLPALDRWVAGLHAAYQGPLNEVVIQAYAKPIDDFPEGHWRILGGVDLTPNDVLDEPMSLDFVDVTVDLP